MILDTKELDELQWTHERVIKRPFKKNAVDVYSVTVVKVLSYTLTLLVHNWKLDGKWYAELEESMGSHSIEVELGFTDSLQKSQELAHKELLKRLSI